jgi:signal recognition particle receptor subunit beta
MALVDPKLGNLVLRVVYDGPAWSGKTTSLRSLATSLGTQIFSTDGAEGRTMFFDWVDYTAGRFEGMPIRCQIVSVPGQQSLVERRRRVLETADVVVFVADSRLGAAAENLRSFALLREMAATPVPPIPIVTQANKRDLLPVVALDDLRDALGAGTMAMTESIAQRGDGIRETFVLAVRLALDRVRLLWARRELPGCPPPVDTPQDLLAALHQAEGGQIETLAAIGMGLADRRTPDPAPPEVVAAEPGAPAVQGTEGTSDAPERPGTPDAPPPPAAQGAPLAPDASVPSGLVWPPVDGRITVHEASREPARLERRRRGDWAGASAGWKLLSPLEALFFDMDEGRAALLNWARWHAAAGVRLSPSRCVVLAAATPASPTAGPQAWRLWQVVRRLPSLQDRVGQLFAQPDDIRLGEGLVAIAQLRLRAEEDLCRAGWLRRVDLGSLSADASERPVYIGFVPFPAEPPVARQADGDAGHDLRQLRAELGPLLRHELAQAPQRLPEVLRALQAAATRRDQAAIADTIKAMLLEI